MLKTFLGLRQNKTNDNGLMHWA